MVCCWSRPHYISEYETVTSHSLTSAYSNLESLEYQCLPALPYEDEDVESVTTTELAEWAAPRAVHLVPGTNRVTTRAQVTYELDSSCESDRLVVADEEHGEGIEVSKPNVISTRGRFTYGLERFEKNAMIILAHSEEREERIQILKESFGKYRFHAEVHIGLSIDAMENTLTEFFGRDFSHYGAVAIVVLSNSSESGLLEVQGQRVHESLFLRWFTSDQPSALRGKPKIYITEADRKGVHSDNGVYSLPITSLQPDVIGIHIPAVIEKATHPLKILCEMLGSHAHFLDDVYEAARLAEVTLPELWKRPVQVDSTLLRNVCLAKTQERKEEEHNAQCL